MTRATLHFASFAFHGVLAVGVVSLRSEGRREDVSISVVESKKKVAPEPITPPTPPEPPPVKAVPQAASRPAPHEPTPAPASATPDPTPASTSDVAPDFGLSLGGTGGALVAARVAPASSSRAAEQVTKKVLAAAPLSDTCAEPVKKPRLIDIGQPAYTAAARDASIAGKVRVEVTVDVTGTVTAARVLEGLGHGLDEAALATARAATFEPATRCGKPASATFTIAMRFAL